MSCLLSVDDIMQSINKARISFSKGVLNRDVVESTVMHFWRFQPNTADINKGRLLEIAKKNLDKPSYKKHPLGRALATYVNKNMNTYDPDFTKKIKSIRPDWFVNKSKERKNKLIELARSGCKRPNQKKNPLGYNLSSYTSVKSTCYDKEFTKKIKAIAPHWFGRFKKTS